VKILTDIVLRDIEGLQEHCICVDPFAVKDAVQKNAAALLRGVRWLGARAAGDISSYGRTTTAAAARPRPPGVGPSVALWRV